MAYTTIDKPSDYFTTKLYTGNNTTQTITGLDFQSNFTWIKSRSTGEHHILTDACRGVNSQLNTNRTNAPTTATNKITAFNSDGFDLGAGDEVNNGSTTYVSWNWLANGAGAANTAGSIDTTKTSAETTSGCSIIQYTGNGSNGATIGHGTGIKPSMVIVKELNGGNDWIVYTQALTANKILYLNTTGGENDNNVFFNDTEPTTSLITLGTISATNGDGIPYIAYCFSDVQGFSKQGSYIGNGSTDGAFVYTGFKPDWVLIKRASTGGDQWQLSDSKRGVNGAIKTLYTDSAEVETSSDSIDHLSNGFKNRATSVARNGSGDTYIYMAFAENPFVTSTGIPATAR